MNQLFPRGAALFERVLLEILSCGGGLPASFTPDLGVPHRPIELALLAAGMAPSLILRGVLDAEARYAAPLGHWYFSLSVLDAFPAADARALGLVPLVQHDATLLALTPEGAPPWRKLAYRGETWDVIQIGTSHDLDADLDALVERSASLRPGTDDIPAYLTRRGVLRGRLDAGAHGPTDLEQWVARALACGASETDTYDAAAAFVDRPLLGAARAAALFDGQRRVDRAFVDAEGVLVLREIGDHLVLLASRIPDPCTLEGLLGAAGGRSAAGYAITPSELQQVTDQIYGPSPAAASQTSPLLVLASAPEEELPASIDLSRFPGVAKGLQAMILQGIQHRASDIHVERYRQRIDVRFRVDGVLHRIDTPWLTPETAQAFITKVKVDAHLDIAERRRPQDGVIRRRLGDRKIDIRIAIQPTLWGENVVMRILDQGAGAPALDELGFEPGVLAELRRLVHNPQGMVLLAGPTGCGKTSTLYAVLRELLHDDLKIVTAEDPIEYAIDGVQQSQVNDAIGDTFDRYLRAFLRQDPDVILVGEIRDAVTAESAVRAAQTGHLVLSTLHVNDAQGSVRRLIDLGVSPSLVSQTLLCVVSQRLGRRVCPQCRRPDPHPDPALLRELFPAGAPAHAAFSHGEGCPRCRDTGYRGRTAFVELWHPDREARGLIDRGATTEALIDQALATRMRSLVVDATEKAAAGLTTLEELHAVLSYDQLARHRERLPTRRTRTPSAVA